MCACLYTPTSGIARVQRAASLILTVLLEYTDFLSKSQDISNIYTGNQYIANSWMNPGQPLAMHSPSINRLLADFSCVGLLQDI